jgi:hypothetical protein
MLSLAAGLGCPWGVLIPRYIPLSPTVSGPTLLSDFHREESAETGACELYIVTMLETSVIGDTLFGCFGGIARQMLYHLSPTSSPFCSGYFEIGSHFLPRPTWIVIVLFMLLTIAEMTGICNRAQLVPHLSLLNQRASLAFCG